MSGFSFGSLRGRLFAGFILVIFLTLVAAGSTVVWLIQDYQRRFAVDRLSEVAIAASFVSRQLEGRDVRADDIAMVIANQFVPSRVGRVHVLVTDSQGRVQSEQPAPSGPLDVTFRGKTVDLPAPFDPSARGVQVLVRGGAAVWTDAPEGPAKPYIYITAPILPVGGRPSGSPSGRDEADSRTPRDDTRGGDPLDRLLPRQQVAYRVVLAVPERDLASAWRELIPSLAIAFLVAVAVSAAVSLWLSRSIALPLRQITRAARGMARGELRQAIPVNGRDEVAHLATAFNQMSEEVERSHRALRDFLADASHELRTPLTSIQGFSQALVDGTLSGEEGASEAGGIILDEANRMRGLVEDLLYLSRMESQEVHAAREPVDAAALLREVSRRLSLVAEQRGLTVRLDVPRLPPVLGDADQLDRVFVNLLDNAGKYTPPGGAVDVRAERAASVLRVVVHNTGSVIPAEDLPHVFERFYRVDKSRAREVEGSGLGLAIVHEIVARHGGAITVTSSEAQGTTFTVTLPLAPRAGSDVPAGASTLGQPAAAVATFRARL